MNFTKRDSDEWLAFACGLVALIFAVLCVWGYIANIIAIANVTGDLATPRFVLRCLGVVIMPLGMLMGWL